MGVVPGVVKNIVGKMGTAALLIATIGMSGSASAATAEGSLVFLKGLPTTGLVYINGGKTFSPDDLALDQKDQVFSKILVLGKSGSVITFHNSDVQAHNVYVQAGDADSKVNLGDMAPGVDATAKVDWSKGSVARVGCNIHPRMIAYIYNLPSELHMQFEFEKGVLEYPFTIENVPAGQASFVVWLPNYDPIEISLTAEEQSVKLTKGGKVRGFVNVTLN